MYYFEAKNLGSIFDIVYTNYVSKEEVPRYTDEQVGIEKLLGIFTGVRMDEFYSTITDKAAYMLIQINKGHFFSNGNKRLALVCSIGFLAINDTNLKILDKSVYKKKLEELFPTFLNYEDQVDFSPEEFALYNLSIIIADSHKYTNNDFEILKSKVKNLFDFSIEKNKNSGSHNQPS